MEISSHEPSEAEILIGHEDDTELTPCEGMEFESEDAARDFYSLYARHAGFRIRISRYTRSRRDNSIISRRIVCSKEGFHETRNCEGLHPDQKQQERTGTRVGCKAMIMIKKIDPGKWVVTKFVKTHNHGSVPPRKLDIRSAHQDLNPVEKPHSAEEDPVEEPVEGMEFDSEETAKLFYINYARLNGFRARISRYCRSRRDNSIISRQIVCSKEGFREVRAKKEITDEGKTKRPRMITRVGCKAMIVVKKMNSGKWMVSKFEKEHNHSLLSSKQSTDSLTVLYNQLCQEAIKFAKEGSVTEEIYHVAMSALKEAAEKVAQLKSCHPTMPHRGVSSSESKHKVVQMKTMSASQCSDVAKQKTTPSQLTMFQESTSKLMFIPTNLLTDSGLANSDNNHPSLCAFTSSGRQCRHGSECSYLHAENRKEDCPEKYQNSTSSRATQGNHSTYHGHSEETTVAIPAIPLTLYMPLSRNSPGASADGQYKLLAAPIEAVPISYRPAEPIRQPKRSFCNLGPLPGVMSELTRREKGPHPLVHATALACGARVVPVEEAASLIKAIESKIRSGGAKIARLPSSRLTRLVPEAVSMSSSSEDGEDNDHSEPPAVNVEGYCHDDQISEEMKLQGEASELETDSEN
uniref:C3H1-type domain-containing protein n=1 Tax=Aegilops tauschii subsp. strangulata TaxID=200361 RepID=A0A453IH14_AEGTS